MVDADDGHVLHELHTFEVAGSAPRQTDDGDDLHAEASRHLAGGPGDLAEFALHVPADASPRCIERVLIEAVLVDRDVAGAVLGVDDEDAAGANHDVVDVGVGQPWPEQPIVEGLPSGTEGGQHLGGPSLAVGASRPRARGGVACGNQFCELPLGAPACLTHATPLSSRRHADSVMDASGSTERSMILGADWTRIVQGTRLPTMRKLVLDLRPGDRFVWEDKLSDETQVLTVRSGPFNHFGSVTVEVEEWDFDFEATTSCAVEVVSESHG
ncbi:MAG TPA: hypothetical protein PKW89_04045 [Phycicoccus elongatus]|nr:hypothetical protein [Phycicoccus elongatus]HPF75818.1 hypothetical protein [Phycicoccus elongatus]